MYHTPKSVVSALAVTLLVWPCSAAFGTHLSDQAVREDRKSTRLNSSHDQISYAVFCLKKKKSDPSVMLLLAPKSHERLVRSIAFTAATFTVDSALFRGKFTPSVMRADSDGNGDLSTL